MIPTLEPDGVSARRGSAINYWCPRRARYERRRTTARKKAARHAGDRRHPWHALQNCWRTLRPAPRRPATFRLLVAPRAREVQRHTEEGCSKRKWYSWVASNHRPPVPQTGALTI